MQRAGLSGRLGCAVLLTLQRDVGTRYLEHDVAPLLLECLLLAGQQEVARAQQEENQTLARLYTQYREIVSQTETLTRPI